MAEIAAHEAVEDGSDDEEDEEHSDASDAGEGEEELVEEKIDASAPQDDRIPDVEPTSSPPSLENLHLSPLSTTDPADDDSNSSSNEQDSDSEDESDRDTIAESLAHRRHRPSKRTAPPTAADVGAIVTEKLRRAKTSTERRHHGKKPVTANVLGRQRGSKMKQDSRRAIKDANTF
jgi:hypothetical protein